MSTTPTDHRDYGDECRPRPALRLAPPPAPRPDTTLDALNRVWSLYYDERTARESAAVRATVLATALDARDATIAALRGRLEAVEAICAAGWVAAGCLSVLLVLAWRF